ncbi:TetR/AcrR family transcriptional regulator [Gordonia insulae]|uniref:HTH-type transcriptional regulator BetI n=1 Tax=Gordonia insulae TaxID=2420509 RepID=A0A3G8JR69_9ACTN|nr:TetR/AcrR family transcriptional regulator [Gordonia insulae]AZG47597.1 HTH-type transcriptional regulator BetI [Gordonia insulae]
MTDVQTTSPAARRSGVDKFDARRNELAVATLHTLAALGYARTSLREIAQNSEYSHGVLHYYFTDKLDLITHAVRQYEAVCVTRYDDVIARATTADELRDEFATTFIDTLSADTELHRLWYDLRNQSFFDESFRDDVIEIDNNREAMIWRVVSRYAELCETTPAVSPSTAYVAVDGLFQRGLLQFIAGRTESLDALRAELISTFDVLVK